MFCAIATTIERCKTEGVVDVFQVVKALRMQKPGAVCNVVSYIIIATYIHLCMHVRRSCHVFTFFSDAVQNYI